MHTSTMTVAVLPQPTEVQLYMMDGWYKQYQFKKNQFSYTTKTFGEYLVSLI